MRLRVAITWTILGTLAAGGAWARDATQVVYDLSTLRSPQATAPTAQASKDLDTPASPILLPLPSQLPGSGGDVGISDGNLEERPINHRPNRSIGSGSPRGGQDPPSDNPSPTPEPGTLLLLGGALASGARFFRRR
jgi:hypothetical protein